MQGRFLDLVDQLMDLGLIKFDPLGIPADQYAEFGAHISF